MVEHAVDRIRKENESDQVEEDIGQQANEGTSNDNKPEARHEEHLTSHAMELRLNDVNYRGNFRDAEAAVIDH